MAYFLVLILALSGVAYTSFSGTPITKYWIILAPFIGIICVIARWRDAENREQRSRLVWTQALHWAAVLAAMHLMFVADVGRMMNADASALAALTILALGTFTAGVHIMAWRICLIGVCWRSASPPSLGSSNRRCCCFWSPSLPWRSLHHFSGPTNGRVTIDHCHPDRKQIPGVLMAIFGLLAAASFEAMRRLCEKTRHV